MEWTGERRVSKRVSRGGGRERERETGWFKGSPRSSEGGQDGQEGMRSAQRSAESECLEPHITATQLSSNRSCRLR